jgi:hypothetical protein
MASQLVHAMLSAPYKSATKQVQNQVNKAENPLQIKKAYCYRIYAFLFATLLAADLFS